MKSWRWEGGREGGRARGKGDWAIYIRSKKCNSDLVFAVGIHTSVRLVSEDDQV